MWILLVLVCMVLALKTFSFSFTLALTRSPWDVAASAKPIGRLKGNAGDHRMELTLAELEAYLEEVDLTLQERDTIARILERLRNGVTAL